MVRISKLFLNLKKKKRKKSTISWLYFQLNEAGTKPLCTELPDLKTNDGKCKYTEDQTCRSDSTEENTLI